MFNVQDMSVGDDDGDVRPELGQILVQIAVARVLGLKERDLFVERNLLHRRRNYLARSSLRLVRPGDDANDLESFTDESAQSGLGKVRRAPEYYAHYISVS